MLSLYKTIETKSNKTDIVLTDTTETNFLELEGMQCQEKPADFYNQLEEVRSLRDNLDQRTSRLDSLLDDYWAEFNGNVREQING